MSCKKASVSGQAERFPGRHKVAAAEIVEQVRLVGVPEPVHRVLHIEAIGKHHVLPQQLIAHQRCKGLGGCAHHRVEHSRVRPINAQKPEKNALRNVRLAFKGGFIEKRPLTLPRRLSSAKRQAVHA